MVLINKHIKLSRHMAPMFFPLREVPILKRDTNEENHCLIKLFPFDVRNFFSVLATKVLFG